MKLRILDITYDSGVPSKEEPAKKKEEKKEEKEEKVRVEDPLFSPFFLV